MPSVMLRTLAGWNLRMAGPAGWLGLAGIWLAGWNVAGRTLAGPWLAG